MTDLKINGVVHDMADGFIYNDKYTEELDSGTITIPFSDKLDLSPFDFVEISDDRFGTKYFVIDTWIEETVSFNPLKYNYTINLVSETIKLQKVVLPNITITHPIGKTPKSIGEKLSEYWQMYVTPQYPELIIDNMYADFDSIDCPEGEYNRPTMFEVFNTILGKVNSVVKVENHQIKYIKLDEYGNAINEDKLYYNNDTQTIKDYANRLDVQVANGISEAENHSTIAGISVRAGENEAVLNDDNMLILLEKPIYDMKEIGGVYAYFPYVDEENGEEVYKIAKLDITDNIVEKAVYDTYKVSNSVGLEVGNYRRNALYYVRGQKTIEGLSYNESSWVGTSTDIALLNIIQVKLSNISNTASLGFPKSQVRDKVIFRVEYKTNENYRYIVEKNNDYNATLIDNQTENQIDNLNFGKVEQDKLNRLGNKNMIITATYERDEIIPELGDYIGKYVLAEREIVYYKDYALFKGYLYKDFVRKNMFYGLNSKKRSTQISTESVVRNDIINYDVTFELENTGYSQIARYLLQPLSLSGVPQENHQELMGYDYYEQPKYALIETLKENGESITSPNFIILSPSYFVTGKSNVIHFQFLDNFSAGIKSGEDVPGGQRQEYIKYTDDYGELRSISASIYTNGRKEFIENAETEEEFDNYKTISDNLPLLSTTEAQTLLRNSTNILGVGRLLFKDNRETIAITININFKDNENVIIGNFAEYTGIGYRYNMVLSNIGIVYSTTDEYETGEEYGLGVLDENIVLEYTPAVQHLLGNATNYNYFSLRNANNTSTWKSWGIVEKDTGRLILGVNKGNQQEVPTTIYMKVEEKPY